MPSHFPRFFIPDPSEGFPFGLGFFSSLGAGPSDAAQRTLPPGAFPLGLRSPPPPPPQHPPQTYPGLSFLRAGSGMHLLFRFNAPDCARFACVSGIRSACLSSLDGVVAGAKTP